MAIEVSIIKKLKNFTLDVDLKTEKGVMGILGASGCGKSMTLKCIAGIEKPDAGIIRIDGQAVFDSSRNINIPPQKRKTGYLFQNYALFPTMTVEQNIAAVLNGKKQEKQAEIQKQITRFRLEGLEKRFPSQLSGGQQQRAALARIFAYEPEILLLDEPFSALDCHLKDHMQRQMKRVLDVYNGNVIFVSHSRDEIYHFCSGLAVMSNGRILLNGETRLVFKAPVCVEAARLTGCKNISAAVRVDDFHIYAKDWDLVLKLNEKTSGQIQYVGIRAHDLAAAENAEEENAFPVQLDEIMEAPFEMQYLIKHKGSDAGGVLWWKKPKSSGLEDAAERFPDYIKLPSEALMLLRE